MGTRKRALAFRELHERDGAFILPNPWDVGTARLLASLGFEALATTSAGYAFSTGRQDNAVGRDEILAHSKALVSATDLPVSADLENGFGDDPETVAETIRRAAATGLAGGSIEDHTARADDPIYELDLSVERVRAAAEAARSLPDPFTLTGRAENFLHGRADLADTIRRLQAYQEAGADVLYAPGIVHRADIASVVRSVDRPVNVLARNITLSLDELAELGVKRVSVGGALYRSAMGGLLAAAREMRTQGTFELLQQGAQMEDLSATYDG